jgi:hypothetical protein
LHAKIGVKPTVRRDNYGQVDTDLIKRSVYIELLKRFCIHSPEK